MDKEGLVTKEAISTVYENIRAFDCKWKNTVFYHFSLQLIHFQTFDYK